MRHELDIRPDGALAVVTTHGEACLEGFRAFTDELVRHRLPSRATPVLVDHRDLDLSTMLKADIDAFRRYVAEQLATLRREPHAAAPRLATLVSRTLDFGIVRQWEIPLEDELPMRHRAFLDRDAAVAWLSTEADDPTGDDPA
jgi:hypothetical protein